MRRPRKGKAKLKTTEKVLIICEGETEQCYINQLLRDFNLTTANITVDHVGGGGYTNIRHYIERNRALYSIILVVCDLSRAAHKMTEKQRLKSLIRLIEDENLKNNIFLNSPEIEVWIAACVGADPRELQGLGYEKGNTVGRFLREYNGNYWQACKYFEHASMYFEKRDFRRGTYNEESLSTPHSNLVYFIEYMKALIRI